MLTSVWSFYSQFSRKHKNVDSSELATEYVCLCVCVSILLPRKDNCNIYSWVDTPPPIVRSRTVRKKRKSIFECDEDDRTTESIERYMRATAKDGRDEYISSHHQQCKMTIYLFFWMGGSMEHFSVTFSENLAILPLWNRTIKGGMFHIALEFSLISLPLPTGSGIFHFKFNRIAIRRQRLGAFRSQIEFSQTSKKIICDTGFNVVFFLLKW